MKKDNMSNKDRLYQQKNNFKATLGGTEGYLFKSHYIQSWVWDEKHSGEENGKKYEYS